MSKYVDGFVLPVPKASLEIYREMAAKAAVIWKEHGALAYAEAAGEDLEVAEGAGMVPFPRLAGARPEETVVFAWITFESRAHRDEVNKRVMADPCMEGMCDPVNPPFDFSKMAYGGFQVIVEG